MNRAVQQMNIEEDYIFFTESDQIIYYKNLDLFLDTIDKDKNVYIVPQRFEQIPANKTLRSERRSFCGMAWFVIARR